MVNFFAATLAVLALLSLVLLLWQWAAAQQFPLHRRDADPTFHPGITLLKPLKGFDATTPASLQSWFNQDYPGPTQILFGIADAADPAGEMVRDLIGKNPGCDAQLVICTDALGASGKVSNLIQLERQAKYDLILVSDADVRVPGDFLANVVSLLRDERIGLVNCFYRLANPVTPAMQCEAVAINADFWSQVLQSATLKPIDFALGAVMLVRRRCLAEMGGFTALADCLADDYQLGHRIARRGHQIALCPIVVECWNAPMGWREVWKHQLRWARTIRVCQPIPYFFSILSNATFWPMLLLIVSMTAFGFGWLTLGAIAALLIRVGLARNLQRRLTPTGSLISPAWLVPIKDMLQAGIWAAAFLGDTVEWRGQQMRLRKDGTIILKQ